MGNRFYVPGDGRAGKVKELFNGIATRYDLINDLQSLGLHRRWKRRLVDWAGAKPGSRVLDLCTGTGDLAFAMARRGAEVIGMDFSAGMLAQTHPRSKTFQKNLKLPRFVQGDALNLPFPDQSFDVASISYGLRNLADFRRGLAEMARVTRPGGTLLILDFGLPPNAWVRGAYLSYLRLAVPLFGRLFNGDPDAYAYILESLKHYPAQEGVRSMLVEMGCREVEVCNLVLGTMSLHRAVI